MTQKSTPDIPHTDRPRQGAHTLHLVALTICYGTAVGGFIYAMIALGAMPRTVGYHFSASGTFDLFGDKSIAFLHPLIAEILLLATFTLFAYIATRVKPLKRFSPTANHRIIGLSILVCDLFSLATVAIFSHWIYCVAEQTPLHTDTLRIVLAIPAVAFLLFVMGLLVAICAIRIPLLRAKRRN